MVRRSIPSALPPWATRLLKTAPVVVGSVLLHAGIALALVATAAGGHARTSITLPVATLDVDLAQVDAPLLEPVKEMAPSTREHEAAVPAHTHPYPVALSHNAHPHDPSLHHDNASSTPAPPAPTHDDDHVAEPAQAAPVHVAEAAGLPRFVIPSDAGLATGGHVSADGVGSGGAGASGGGDDVIVPASSVQVPAKLVSSVVAAYPSGARSDDVEGDVGVEIVVDRDGRVVEARVARPAGHGFDDAALKAIRRYRFTAARRQGQAVRVRMPWSVQFRLR